MERLLVCYILGLKKISPATPHALGHRIGQWRKFRAIGIRGNQALPTVQPRRQLGNLPVNRYPALFRNSTVLGNESGRLPAAHHDRAALAFRIGLNPECYRIVSILCADSLRHTDACSARPSDKIKQFRHRDHTRDIPAATQLQRGQGLISA
ncbi:hypothetical protein [Novosphingobium guangzhouense]|uniref:hypothetical protein n=1 Tax=Novosphingobium guangzhouense TaxID=1850347 RepID=UPI003183FCA8